MTTQKEYIEIEQDTIFVALDLETTGIEVEHGHKICEVGAVRFKGKEEIESLQSLIDPGREIPLNVFPIHGIANEMVVGKPTFEEFFPKLKAFVGSDILVMHNAGFDLSFLWNEAKDLDSEWPEQEVICTMQLAMEMGGFEKYSLAYLCERFNITYQKHRALEDARATGELFNKLVNVL